MVYNKKRKFFAWLGWVRIERLGLSKVRREEVGEYVSRVEKLKGSDRERRSWPPLGNSLRLSRAGSVSGRYISRLASQWRIVCIEATTGERGATLINEPINNGNVSTENSAG